MHHRDCPSQARKASDALLTKGELVMHHQRRKNERKVMHHQYMTG